MAVLSLVALSQSTLTAANGVAPSRLALTTRVTRPNDLKPAVCSTMLIQDLILGTGSFGQGSSISRSALVIAGPGKDQPKGGPGDDCLVAGGGDDALNGGQGIDVCIGGPGADAFSACEVIDD